MFTLIYHEIDPKTGRNVTNNIVSARIHPDNSRMLLVYFADGNPAPGAIPIF